METPRRILFVDDEPDIREFISYSLSRKGFQVFTAPDGKAGYELAVEHRPHLVILDILMPVMNGYETCRRMRKNPLFTETKILFLSALSESYVRELGEQLDADGYISKPVRMEMLIRKVSEWARK
jgi:two-component system alkaline phosphatase synthesis response regulator PhoP